MLHHEPLIYSYRYHSVMYILTLLETIKLALVIPTSSSGTSRIASMPQFYATIKRSKQLLSCRLPPTLLHAIDIFPIEPQIHDQNKILYPKQFFSSQTEQAYKG